MSKKKEPETFTRHCEIFIPMHGGKATCPKCKAAFDGGRWSKVEKPNHKKKSADSIHDIFTTRIGMGILFAVIIPALGIDLILRVGWDNLAATVIVISLMIGAVCFGALNGKKA